MKRIASSLLRLTYFAKALTLCGMDRFRAPVAVVLGVLAIGVLVGASVQGWELGAARDWLAALAGAAMGYLVPSPGDARRALPPAGPSA